MSDFRFGCNFIKPCVVTCLLRALCILWSGVMDWSLGLEPWSGVLEWILGVEPWSVGA